MRQVALIGWGQTTFVSRNLDQSIVEMVAEAVDAALADAGMELSQVDAAVTASVDLWDGRTASNVALTEVVGAVMGPETRISADGLGAFVHAVMTVAAGAYRTALCVAHCKPSESDHQALTAWTLDPVFLQPLGLDDDAAAGLQAELSGSDPEAWARAVVQARARAARNPLGPGLEVPSAEQVLAAPRLAGPLTQEMVAPLCDGAVAVILARAEDGAERPRVTGFGYASESHYLGERDLTGVPALRTAARRAGIAPATVKVAEISAPYAHQQELFADALGLDRGLLNPSGGSLGGVPPFAAGLARLVEAARRLGAGQCGLAHGAWGPAAQAHCVVGLEG